MLSAWEHLPVPDDEIRLHAAPGSVSLLAARHNGLPHPDTTACSFAGLAVAGAIVSHCFCELGPASLVRLSAARTMP